MCRTAAGTLGSILQVAGLAPIALLIFMPRAAAGWPTTSSANVSISSAAQSQQQSVMASDGNGGAIIAWTDRRSSLGFDVFAQRVDALGRTLWKTDGVQVSSSTSAAGRAAIVADGSGGAIVAWADGRNGSTDIFAQRLSAEGTPLWAPNGVPACTAADDQSPVVLASDGTGGAILAWEDRRSGTNFDIYAQRVDATGAPLWQPDGIPICALAGSQSEPSIVAGASGDAIILWADNRAGAGNHIYAQRVTAIGVAAWVVNGVALCTATGAQDWPAPIPDGAGGAVVGWWDNRSGNRDIYAQRVSLQGAPQWTPNGVAICTEPNSQGVPELAPDGSGGAVIVWNDHRNGTDEDIYAMRVSAAGVTQWANNGIPLSTASGDQYALAVTSDGQGGAIAAWQDARTGSLDIYAQRVNTMGSPRWTGGGRAICLATGGQYETSIVSDGGGGAILSWTDDRAVTAPDVFAQRVASDGALGDALVSLSSISPASGAAGDSVVLVGGGFADLTAVRFNGVSSPTFRVTADSQQVVAHVPFGAKTGPVSVGSVDRGSCVAPREFRVVRQTTLPASPGTPRYVGVATPITAPDTTSRGVGFAALGLGAPDSRRWRLWHWEVASGSYVEAGRGLDSLLVGQGYWLITRDPLTPSLRGPLVSHARELDIPLPATSGDTAAWFQLGNPFDQPIRGWQLLARRGARVVPLTGSSNDITDDTPRWFDPGQQLYVVIGSDSIIPAGAAFWVKRLPGQGADVHVVVHPDVDQGGPIFSPSRPPGPMWTIELTARQDGADSQPVRIGAAVVESGVWNRWCVASPPPLPGTDLALAIPEPDWGRRSGSYQSVIQSSADVMAWDLVLSGARGPGEVQLRTSSHGFPAGLCARVTDPGRLDCELPSSGSVRIAATGMPRVLRVTVERTSRAPASPRASCVAAPNPFAAAVGFVIPIASPEDLQVSIFDVAGRAVRRIQRPAAPIGENVLVWDGMDSSGRPARPGLYFALYRVGGSMGRLRVVKVL